MMVVVVVMMMVVVMMVVMKYLSFDSFIYLFQSRFNLANYLFFFHLRNPFV